MATGTSTFEGLAVPLHGESQIIQSTAATDILTITGATSQSGDFLVLENSTGAELFVITSSGSVTSNVGITATTGTFSGVISAALTSSALNAVTVAVTSTGAIAAGTAKASALYVYASSKSVLNSIVTYVTGPGSEVGSCNSFLAAHGSKAPSYLLSVGSTAMGVGDPGSNGLVLSGQFLVSALATTVPIQAIKVLLGDSPWYIPCVTSTTIAAS